MKAIMSDEIKSVLNEMTNEEHRMFSYALHQIAAGYSPAVFYCGERRYELTIARKDIK
jgi:hypothetical protein